MPRPRRRSGSSMPQRADRARPRRRARGRWRAGSRRRDGCSRTPRSGATRAVGRRAEAARSAAGWWSSGVFYPPAAAGQPFTRLSAGLHGSRSAAGALGEDPHGLGGHRARRAGQLAAVDPVHGLDVAQAWRSGRSPRPGPGRRSGRSVSLAPVHSTTSARVMPARQPEASGGVCSSPSRTTKTLEPVPSQSCPTVLANSASDAPCSRARARATTFSPYEVVFRPVERAALVAGPGDGDHGGGVGAAGGLAEGDDQGRAVRRRGRSRAGERPPV